MHKRGAHFQSIDTIAHATCYSVAACTTNASRAYQAVSVDVQACIPASVVECTTAACKLSQKECRCTMPSIICAYISVYTLMLVSHLLNSPDTSLFHYVRLLRYNISTFSHATTCTSAVSNAVNNGCSAVVSIIMGVVGPH